MNLGHVLLAMPKAGTGKSTLVKFIIQALNLDPEDVTYIAYTGKAALILKEKGCPNAMTSHRLIYESFRCHFKKTYTTFVWSKGNENIWIHSLINHSHSIE